MASLTWVDGMAAAVTGQTVAVYISPFPFPSPFLSTGMKPVVFYSAANRHREKEGHGKETGEIQNTTAKESEQQPG